MKSLIIKRFDSIPGSENPLCLNKKISYRFRCQVTYKNNKKAVILMGRIISYTPEIEVTDKDMLDNSNKALRDLNERGYLQEAIYDGEEFIGYKKKYIKKAIAI